MTKSEGQKEYDFLWKMKIQEKEETKQIKNDWNNFIQLFWIIFVIKIGGQFLLSLISRNFGLSLGLWSLQFLPVGAMVALMGFYAYKISEKKSYIVFGLLGLLWYYIFPIFIGCFVLKRITNYAIKKPVVESNNFRQKKEIPKSASEDEW